jgi:hypothetical protein
MVEGLPRVLVQLGAPCFHLRHEGEQICHIKAYNAKVSNVEWNLLGVARGFRLRRLR